MDQPEAPRGPVPDSPRRVSFGARDVDENEKAGLVRGVFDGVAPAYDVMNDLMSLGVHRAWKSVLLDRLNPQPGQRLLDVAGGTGDVARGFLARAAERPARGRPSASATICDINHAMMVAGRDKDGRAVPDRVCADAEALPFEDAAFDAYTVAFGIRNVTHRDRALSEARRVLKPGGRFVCLEFSRPVTASFEALYAAYSDAFIPRLGRWVADDEDSYRYLVESIRRFPPQDAFALEVEDAGFARVKVENLTGGVAALHMGWRI
ncbi:class I SAM-dependent methyltransferase [Parvularcula dongshanensis]|uniref:Ubiquinone/menaquinone biosynthesis C-methyltransferase UbiE n=1 Tax=Parvularcula dongshanensis TaxID=1173995 RepID=A0A840I1Y6_9PROT|nr:class I SAM-dependent methyltransferase [Parvularcula dongshanensis]MBB4658254.1 demethylmenaquinone methyltransferase/2-methoxy-6-polyprenyl-1,4-benzoquinol methylase [Parvularcula dongshanensis]